jgi:hypothetical protein
MHRQHDAQGKATQYSDDAEASRSTGRCLSEPIEKRWFGIAP